MSAIVSNIVEVGLFRFHRDRPEYLVLRRALQEVLYPGLWQIVTGSVRENETAVAAAGREIVEEVGVVPLRFWVAPHISSFYDAGQDAIMMLPLFAAQIPPDTDPVLSREHDRYAWLEVEAACRRLVWPGQREALRLIHDCIAGGEVSGRLLETPFPQDASR
jgi:dATP pyrophosphohydrolase